MSGVGGRLWLAAWGVVVVALLGSQLATQPVVQGGQGLPLTPEFIVSVVAGVLALALDLVPGLKQRWDGLRKEWKRFAWLLGCFVVGIGPWALGCLSQMVGIDLSGLWFVGTCGVDTFARGMQVAVSAYFVSQSVHGVVVGGAKAIAYVRDRW